MGLMYVNLDEITRKDMLNELDYDIHSDSVYISTRLTPQGATLWSSRLREAIVQQNDDWLASQLQHNNYLNTHEQRSRAGKTYLVKVPYTAAITLAEGEFNRFYARGLCVRAIRDGIKEVEVYRAKQVMQPRYESERLIGQKFSPSDLLNDLRNSKGVEPALGVPPGPNSGISIKIPT